MDRFELERRTKRFALRVIAFVDTLPKSKAGEVIEYQLVKAGTSIGSNYRGANRAESRNDFIHKIGIVGKGIVGELLLAGVIRRSRLW